jgi:hypothetical protein
VFCTPEELCSELLQQAGGATIPDVIKEEEKILYKDEIKPKMKDASRVAGGRA